MIKQVVSATQELQQAAKKRKILLYAIALALLVLAPFVAYPVFLMKILCLALFAAAFNLVLGYTGLLSFGHAAFLATGGYFTGYLLSHHAINPEMAILTGTLAAVILGTFFGLLSIRRQGIYFAMITLALAQLVYFFYLQAEFTGGEDGMQGVPRGKLFGFIDLYNNYNLYYMVLAIFIFGYLLIQRTIHSPFGQVLKAIRENEPRAVSLGYNVDTYKLVAFIISAGLAGLAGSTKTIVFQLASLNDAHWHMSGEVILMTLVGGVGTLIGPVVGAGFVLTLTEQLAKSSVGDWVNIILGVVFVMCVLAFRAGIVGEIQKFTKRNFK